MPRCALGEGLVSCTSSSSTHRARCSTFLPQCLHDRPRNSRRMQRCARVHSEVELSSRYGTSRDNIFHAAEAARGRARKTVSRLAVKAVNTSPSRSSKYDGHEEGRSSIQPPAVASMLEPMTEEAMRAERKIGTNFENRVHSTKRINVVGSLD